MGDLAGVTEQVGRRGRRRAKLAREIVGGRTVAGDGQANEQVEVLRALGLFEDFEQLAGGIEREGPHAHFVGEADGFAAFDRMHEVELRAFAKEAFDEAHFVHGRHVELAHAGGKHMAQEVHARIALHGVKDLARELADEAVGLAADGGGENALHRRFGLEALGDVVNGAVEVLRSIGGDQICNAISRLLLVHFTHYFPAWPLSAAQISSVPGSFTPLGPIDCQD